MQSDDVANTSNTIVRCAHCDTKFLVPSREIQASDSPRFHCSKCDSVFTLSESEAKGESTKTAKVPAPTTAEIIHLPGRKTTDLISEQLPSPAQLRGATKTFDELRAFASRLTSTSSRSTAEIPLSRPQPEPAPVTPPPAKTASRPIAQVSGQSYTARDNANQALPPKVLIIPIVSIAVLLITVALYFGLSPSAVDSLSTSLFASAPHSPPAEISVRASKFKMIELDNGELIPMVLGEVQNRSTGSFRDVMVEAVLYDEHNEIVARKTTPAPSKLANSKIRNLDSAKIIALQNSPNTKTPTISALDRARFAVAFSRADAARARYYATRVYSVQNE